MDIQSFIQSGLLEAYVTGQCTAAERAEVERMAAAHPEVRAELDAIEETLEKVAQANAVAPPPGLKEQVLQRISENTPGAAGRSGFRLISILGWIAAAALGLILAWQINTANAEKRRLEAQLEDCNTRAAKQDSLQKVIALMQNCDFREITLAAADTTRNVSATLWHNADHRAVILDINTLQAPPAGKYYQFWAIVEGAPKNMGMVRFDAPGALQFIQSDFDKIQAFAISAEDNPKGNPVPSVVVMVGKPG